MTLQEELNAILGDSTKTTQVLALLNARNPMKRYLNTTDGKASKQRSNAKYNQKVKGSLSEIHDHITKWCTEALQEIEYEDGDESITFVRYPTINELWHHSNLSLTRKRYGELLLEEFPEAYSCVDEDQEKVDYTRTFELKIAKYAIYN